MSKEAFEAWIKRLKKAKKKQEILLEKLAYLNVQFYSCRGVQFDAISRKSNDPKSPIVEILCRIEEVENSLKQLDSDNLIYQKLYQKLTEKEKELLSLLVLEDIPVMIICLQLNISKNRLYNLKTDIYLEWLKI